MEKKKKQKKKNIIGIIITVVIIGIIISGIIFYGLKNSVEPEDSTYTVISEVFENIIEVSGTIEAAKSQTLQIAGEGTVEAVYVEEGAYVIEGTIILQLNNAEQEYSLAQLDYNIEQKRITGSAKEVELMQKQRDMIMDQLEDRQVIAMFDGIVAQLDVAEGDVFETKDTIGMLINRDYLSVPIEVVETDVSRLAIGQKVNMTFPAYKDGIILGAVVSWPSVGRITSSGSTVVDVEVRIDNPPKEILPNYSFIGDIEISPPETLLLVERAAIGREGDTTFAFIIEADGSTTKKDIVVVPYDNNYIKILDGLAEGDVLAIQAGAESGSVLRSRGPSLMRGGR